MRPKLPRVVAGKAGGILEHMHVLDRDASVRFGHDTLAVSNNAFIYFGFLALSFFASSAIASVATLVSFILSYTVSYWNAVASSSNVFCHAALVFLACEKEGYSAQADIRHRTSTI